jgi:hypothetical protein
LPVSIFSKHVYFHRVRVGQIFDFVKLLLILKMYLEGWSSSIKPISSALIDTFWPVKPQGKMIRT